MDSHLDSVETTIGAGDGLTAADAPLLALVRTLARQMDESGPQGPGTHLAGTYLTAVRLLMSRIVPRATTGRTSSTLARLRAEHGNPRAS